MDYTTPNQKHWCLNFMNGDARFKKSIVGMTLDDWKDGLSRVYCNVLLQMSKDVVKRDTKEQ